MSSNDPIEVSLLAGQGKGRSALTLSNAPPN